MKWIFHFNLLLTLLYPVTEVKYVKIPSFFVLYSIYAITFYRFSQN